VSGLGFGELLLIVLVLFFFFGAKRLPEIARGLGGGIRSFKAELRGDATPPEPPATPLPPDDPSAPR
jgi:TatA/E family protein of Tat protein translocase